MPPTWAFVPSSSSHAWGQSPNGARRPETYDCSSTSALARCSIPVWMPSWTGFRLECSKSPNTNPCRTTRNFVDACRCVVSRASTMLAIDDVGAGYSSMSHVLQLHPQFIKIDRSLVHKAHRDPNKLAVFRGLVGFARQCGITSLAEGVETTEELNALRAVGVDLVQGYLLARPGEGWPEPRRWRSAPGGSTHQP